MIAFRRNKLDEEVGYASAAGEKEDGENGTTTISTGAFEAAREGPCDGGLPGIWAVGHVEATIETSPRSDCGRFTI